MVESRLWFIVGVTMLYPARLLDADTVLQAIHARPLGERGKQD